MRRCSKSGRIPLHASGVQTRGQSGRVCDSSHRGSFSGKNRWLHVAAGCRAALALLTRAPHGALVPAAMRAHQRWHMPPPTGLKAAQRRSLLSACWSHCLQLNERRRGQGAGEKLGAATSFHETVFLSSCQIPAAAFSCGLHLHLARDKWQGDAVDKWQDDAVDKWQGDGVGRQRIFSSRGPPSQWQGVGRKPGHVRRSF